MRHFLIVITFVVGCGSRDREQTPTRPAGKRLEMTYSLDLDRAIADRAVEIRRDLEADPSLAVTVTVGADDTIKVVPADSARRDELAHKLATDYKLERVDCAPDVAPAAVCGRITRADAAALRKAALANAVKTIRARLDERKLDDAVARAEGDQIVVELPDLDPDKVSRLKNMIARNGRLEFVVVDSGAQFMQNVYAHVGATRDGTPTDPAALDAGIRGDIDSWRTDAGVRVADFYLTAPDRTMTVSEAEAKRLGCWRPDDCLVTGRVILERYFHALEQQDRSFAIPPNRRVGYEIVEPPPGAKDRRRQWRTYLLESRPRLTGAAITNANASFDPNTNRPIVLVDFNRAAARTFADLTTQIAGKKLAIVLDDRITSAPIITGPITGGRASISLGGGDPTRLEDDAHELETVLKTGSLPAPLREETERTR